MPQAAAEPGGQTVPVLMLAARDDRREVNTACPIRNHKSR
jgi:hypothetical protein